MMIYDDDDTVFDDDLWSKYTLKLFLPTSTLFLAVVIARIDNDIFTWLHHWRYFFRRWDINIIIVRSGITTTTTIDDVVADDIIVCICRFIKIITVNRVS